MDVWLTDSMAPADAASRLRAVAPEGLSIIGVEVTDLKAPSLQSQMRAADYLALVHSQEPVGAIEIRIEDLLAAPTLLRQRHHKGKLQTYDLRPLIQELAVQSGQGDTPVLAMRLQASPQGAGRPDAVLETLGLSLVAHTIERTNLHFEFDK
jgi:radical SAM-linked protein